MYLDQVADHKSKKNDLSIILHLIELSHHRQPQGLYSITSPFPMHCGRGACVIILTLAITFYFACMSRRAPHYLEGLLHQQFYPVTFAAATLLDR